MDKLKDNRALAQAIVDTIREPLLVLDPDLRVIVASRSFCLKFGVEAQAAQGEPLGALCHGQWDIPDLHVLLTRIAPDKGVLENYETKLDFPLLGERTLLLNARRIFYADDHGANILLAIDDVTDTRAIERHRNELLHQKDLLLAEMQHRVANSLAIIASILLIKARTVSSEETKAHLRDAHKRVMSVATVQKHLHADHPGAAIEVKSYLTHLCASLAGSMINDDFCSIEVRAGDGSLPSASAVSIGLIVTELVINALKHAFPDAKPGCLILVSYEVNGTDWKLSVSDNGGGVSTKDWPPAKIGLGTTIVNALAEQLDARVDTVSGPTGTTVSVAHMTFKKFAA